MAKKTWQSYLTSRQNDPERAHLWECVTKPTPDTALNPARLDYLRSEAEKVGLETEIRPLVPGKRPMGLWVRVPAGAGL